MRHAALSIALFLTLQIPALPADASKADREGVRAAVEDYLEALYSVDASRIERSVHPELNKRGLYRSKIDQPYKEDKMTYEELKKLAATWNKDGKRVKPDSPREIILLEVSDVTAVAKLKAVWGFDLMTLGKFDGKWKILQVLYQSYPSGKPE